MKKMDEVKNGIIGMAVFFLVLIGAVSVVCATVVEVEPATQPVQAGQNFRVNVTVDSVTSMTDAGAILHFDPSAMQATSITEGITSGYPHFWMYEDIDNTTGKVTFSYSLQGGSSVSGSGPLATVEFTTNASAECTFDLTLTDVELYNASGLIQLDATNDGTVSLDKTPPTVEILSPENDTWFDSEEVWITFHPWDNKDQELDYKIYDNGEEIKNGTAANCSDEMVNLEPISDCDHVITVNVTDDVGLTGSASVTIHVDRTPPTVEIISPKDGEWLDSENVSLTFCVEDNKAQLIDYWVYVDDGEVDSGTLDNGTCIYDFDLGMLDECDHVIRVNVTENVTDYVGKTNFSEVTIHIDLTLPNITILTPIEGWVNTSNCVKLNVSAEDAKSGIDKMWYSLDGGDNETLYDNGNAGETVYGEATIDELGPCGHTIVVYVNNTVGKVNSSAVSFTVYPGDIDFDGKVWVGDVTELRAAYDSRPGDGNWNVHADLDCSDHIWVGDVVILRENYTNDYEVICGIV